MLTRLLIASALATLAVSGVDAARLRGIQLDDADFSAQGLEQLEGRYGAAFPGYAGVNVNNLGAVSGSEGQLPLGLGLAEQLPLLANSDMYQQMALQGHLRSMDRVNTRLGVSSGNLGWTQQGQQQQQQQQQTVPLNWAQQYGDIGTDQISNIDNVQQLGSIGVQQQNWQLPITQQQNWQQQQFGLGMSNVDMINLQQPVTLAQIPKIQQRVSLASAATVMPNYQEPLITSDDNQMQLGYAPVPKQQLQQQNWQQQQQFGGVGMFGAAPAGGASKKTTTAQPIYAQSMVVPKIITQPIYRPHSVTQPILQQQLIQQPIVETRQVIQPVIRRIITQPIIRPEIYESTTIQPTLKTETVVQPHIVQQTVVTPQLTNEYSEQAPIQEAPKKSALAPQVQPVQSAKKNAGMGGLGFSF